MKRLWGFLGLFLTSSLLSLTTPFIPVETTHAQGSGTIILTINYNYSETEDPEQLDELVHRALLLDKNGAIVKYAYTKFNHGGGNETAKARFEQIPPGSYFACVPQTPNLGNLDDLKVKCTEQIDLVAGRVALATLDLSSVETSKLALVTVKNYVNSKPCEGYNIGWILCQGINSMHEGLNTLYLSVFRGLLVIDPLSNTADEDTPEAALYEIWNSFRVIGNIFFFILFLVAVLGQSFSGFQVFSSYQIKTIVPRLVIGVILIQLSWYLSGFIVDFFNVMGAGIRNLVLSPVQGIGDIDFDFSSLGVGITVFALTGGLVGAFALAGGFLGLLFLIPMIFLPAILAVIFGIIIMLLRNAGILLVILMSPIALAAWALPNTAGFAKFWWETFWKLLIMYPLIIMLISFGELGARILVTGNETSIMWNLIAVMALFAPFFLIPYTFRVAQNVLGSVTTGLDGSRKLISERVFGQPWDEGSYAYRARDARNRGRIKRQSKLQYRYLMNDRRAWNWSKGQMFSTDGRKLGPIPIPSRVMGVPFFKRGSANGFTPFGLVLPRSKARRAGLKSRPLGFGTNKGFNWFKRGGEKMLGRQFVDRNAGKREKWGQRLGRLALGRTRARMSVAMNMRPGGVSLDRAMAIRTEAAKQHAADIGMSREGQEVLLALAQYGDPAKTKGVNVGKNLVTGKDFSAYAANMAASAAKDSDEFNGRMISLIKSLNTREQIQTAINIMHDHPLFDAEKLAGVFKGAGFGTQRDDRSMKHRVLSMPQLGSATFKEVRDGITGKKIWVVDKADWGAIADHKISDFLSEMNHNISAGDNSMYHEGAYYGIEEAQKRVKTLVEGYAIGEDRTLDEKYTYQQIEDWRDSITKAVGETKYKKAVNQAKQQAVDDHSKAVELANESGTAPPAPLTKADIDSVELEVRGKMGAEAMVKDMVLLAEWREGSLDELAKTRLNLGEDDDSPVLSEEGDEIKWKDHDLAVDLLLKEKRVANPSANLENIEPEEVRDLLNDTARQQRIMSDGNLFNAEYDAEGNLITDIRSLQIAREDLIIANARERGTQRGFDKLVQQIIATRYLNDPKFLGSLNSGFLVDYADIIDGIKR